MQGEALDKFAKKSVKVLVVGNPANTNALICSHYAPSIPKENFSAMTRLDQNRAAAQLANKAGVGVADVKNVMILVNIASFMSKLYFSNIGGITIEFLREKYSNITSIFIML